MPLLKNTYQPYFPDPNSPKPEFCDSYCWPVVPGDVIRQQWYQTPCSGSLVVDPLFDDFALGAELVTNGTFTGSAAGWTLETSGTGDWLYGTNNITYSGTDILLTAFQTGLTLAAGTIYRVSFDCIIGAGSLDCDLGLGPGTVNVFNGINTSGSYTADVYYGGSTDDRISFSPGSAGTNTLTVDNVSIQAITVSDWINGSWNIDTDTQAACHISGNGTAPLINGTSDYIVDAEYYVARVEVFGYGGTGTVSLYVDDGTGSTATNGQTAISANGFYTYYFTAAQDGVIAFDPTNDFTGCIRNISVYRLRNDFPFQVVNAAGDSIDVTAFVTYFEDKVLLNLDFGAMQEAGDIDFGCYTITVTDSCLVSSDNLVQDGGFSQGTTFWAGGAGAWQYDFTVPGVVTFIFEPLGDNPTLITDGDPIAAGAWTAGAGWAFIGTGWQHTPGSTATLSQSITISAPAIPPAQLYIWHQIRISGRTAGSVTVTISTTTSGAMSTNNTYTTLTLPKPTIGGAVTFAITPTSNFDGTIELVAVHEATRIWSGSPSIANPANTAIVAGNYELEYDVTNIVGNAGNQIGGSAWIRNPSFPPGFIPGIGLGTHTHQQLDYVPGSSVIEIGGDFFDATTNYPGRVTIDNYSVVRIEPFEATYTSECIDFQESFENTTLLTGWCDQNSFDLDFVTTGYLLQMRVECRTDFPTIKRDGLLATFGTGNAQVKYAQLEKFWQLQTGLISEAAHTTIAAIISCNHFTIGELGDSAQEYVAEMEDYTPQWRGEGDSILATVSLNVRLAEGGMKFMRNT